MDENVPKKYACPDCGGTDVDRQAFAWWDEEKQEWEFAIDDSVDGYCTDCGRYTCGQFIPITDLTSAALVAIKQNEAADGV